MAREIAKLEQSILSNTPETSTRPPPPRRSPYRALPSPPSQSPYRGTRRNRPAPDAGPGPCVLGLSERPDLCLPKPNVPTAHGVGFVREAISRPSRGRGSSSEALLLRAWVLPAGLNLNSSRPILAAWLGSQKPKLMMFRRPSKSEPSQSRA
jgi:hypothetical protein